MKNNFEFVSFLESLENNSECIQKALSSKIHEKAVDGEIIGTGRSDYTQDVTGYALINKGKKFVLYDVPGIEGNEKDYEECIQSAVNKAHLVFYVNSDTKKVEQKTAEKIKKYLQNDTDVYSIINVHLPPKAKRNVEIDGTYQDELSLAYQKDSKSIKPQTEKTLKEVLGKNYKDGVLLNGLLSFSACAFDESSSLSTVIPDTEDKNLYKNQQKFLNEYDDDVELMKKDSRIKYVTDVIDAHAENFQEFIIESNKKKLIARLHKSYNEISALKRDSLKCCGKFIDGYKEMKNRVDSAKKDFVSNIKRGYIENAVQDVLFDKLNEMYKIIEVKEGKVGKEDYESFFRSREEEIKNAIQEKMKKDYENAVLDFNASVDEAQKRFGKDIANMLKYASVDFPALHSMNLDKISFPKNLLGKQVSEAFVTVGSLASSGFFLGNLVPGLGGIVGAAIGAVVGILFAVLGFIGGKERRIAKSKNKAKEVFDTVIDHITSELKKKFQTKMAVENVEASSAKIQSYCDAEMEKFKLLENNLNKLVKYIKLKETKLKEMKYGTL